MADALKPEPKLAAVEAKPAPSPEELKAAEKRLVDENAAQEKARHQAVLNKQYLDAAKKGNLAQVRNLLAEGAELLANDDGNTALFYAAQFGRMETVLFLLEKGIPVDVKNRIGSTPLAGAAGSGHKEVARLLYDLGADPFLKNYTGPQTTPYGYAKSAGYDDVADMLRSPRNVDEVTFTRTTEGVTLQEVFNFAHADKLAFIRRGKDGPVEAVTRENFAELKDKAALKTAFDAYAKKGGKRPESDFFPPAPKAPEPPAPKAPEPPAPKKKSWLPWKR